MNYVLNREYLKALEVHSVYLLQAAALYDKYTDKTCKYFHDDIAEYFEYLSLNSSSYASVAQKDNVELYRYWKNTIGWLAGENGRIRKKYHREFKSGHADKFSDFLKGEPKIEVFYKNTNKIVVLQKSVESGKYQLKRINQPEDLKRWKPLSERCKPFFDLMNSRQQHINKLVSKHRSSRREKRKRIWQEIKDLANILKPWG